MDAKEILNQLSPYQPGKHTDEIKRDYNLKKVVKLASNENPFGYSDKLKGSLSTFIREFEIYPDGYASELRTALAKKLHVKETQLVFGSGSDEIVQMICRAYLYPGVNTVMATPTFPQYKHGALIEGAEIKEVPTIEGYHDLEGMLQAIDAKTNVVWLCSPDNPTGTLLSKTAFYGFIKKCPKDVLIVLDEAYYEYIDNWADLNALANLPQFENLMVLRTFSKAFGLAGLRVGYGVASEGIARKLNIIRGPFNTTSISQKAALIALDDEAFVQNSVLKNRTIKHSFEEFLDDIGWSYYDSQTNFLLISTPIKGNDVFQYLLENGFIIRPGEILGYPKTIRVTIGNDRDMEVLKDLLNNLHLKISNEV